MAAVQDRAGAQGRGARRIIVHPGVHKTGSTAIQRHLQRNADLLAGRLIVRTPQEGTPMRPLGRAALAFSLSPSADTETALRVAFEDVLETLPPGDVPAIVSHENLAGAMPGKGGETGLYPRLPRIARAILSAAGRNRVEFVCYVREMAEWRPSVWAQVVRTEGYPRGYRAFTEEIAGLPGWGDLQRRLTDAVGADRLIICATADETDRTRPGRQLLSHAGLSAAEIAALRPLEGPANERLSSSATEFVRRLNTLEIHPHARRLVSDLVARSQNLFAADAPREGTS